MLKANYLNTTTQLVVDSNTDSAQYLFDREPTFQYVSSGYTGATITSIRVNFSQTLTVSRIALVEHNLKSFVAYYNGITANTFALTTTGSTMASNFANNSETSLYLRCTPVDCTSVSFDLRSTITPSVERAIGFLMLSDPKLVLSRNPSAKNYKIIVDPQDVKHTLSDGGTRIQNVADKFTVSLAYKYIATAERDSLKTIWSAHDELVFCPFGTTTAWDRIIFPCVWTGNFEFYGYADDAIGAGFEGKINLVETPR